MFYTHLQPNRNEGRGTPNDACQRMKSANPESLRGWQKGRAISAIPDQPSPGSFCLRTASPRQVGAAVAAGAPGRVILRRASVAIKADGPASRPDLIRRLVVRRGVDGVKPMRELG